MESKSFKIRCQLLGTKTGAQFLVIKPMHNHVEMTWHLVSKHRVAVDIKYEISKVAFERILHDVKNGCELNSRPISTSGRLMSLIRYPYVSFMSLLFIYHKIGSYTARNPGSDWAGVSFYLAWSNKRTVLLMRDWFGGFGWGRFGRGTVIDVADFLKIAEFK